VDHFLDNFSRKLPGITITKSPDSLAQQYQSIKKEDWAETLCKPSKPKFKMYTIMSNFPQIILLLSLSHLTLGNPTPILTQTTLLIPSIASKLSSYAAQVTTEAKHSSVASVIATALPLSLYSQLGKGGLFTDDRFTTESWYEAIPSDVKSYMTSVASVEQSITAATATALHAESSKAGAVETGVPRAVVGIVGAVGAAALML
jgi:hypothetical protein